VYKNEAINSSLYEAPYYNPKESFKLNSIQQAILILQTNGYKLNSLELTIQGD